MADALIQEKFTPLLTGASGQYPRRRIKPDDRGGAFERPVWYRALKRFIAAMHHSLGITAAPKLPQGR